MILENKCSIIYYVQKGFLLNILEEKKVKKLLRKVLATVLAVSMTMTSISVTNINVKAAASATATNANVTIEDNTMKAFGVKDGDLYNYIKYGVNTTSDDGVEDGRDASKAVDGSTDTRWANSNHTNGHWIQIDLKQSYSVSKIGISWEVASSIDYKIEISNDGRSYKEVSRVKISDYTDPKNRVDTVALSNAVSARYVKITDVGDSYLADSGNNRRYGVSIWEIGIFGSEAKASVESTISDTGVFTKKTNNTGEAFSDILKDQYYNYVRNNGVSATASGVEDSSKTPISGAIDNDATTRWSDTHGDGTYYTVDLGATYSVEKVYLSWEHANATVYNIYKSENGTDYSLITTVYNSEAYNSDSYARVDKIEFSAVNARYIKIQAVQRTYKNSGYSGGQYNGISLYEVGIYGNEQEKSYSKKAFEEFSVGNKETVGNKIEAENTDSRADGVKDDDNSSASGSKNIGGLSDGKWVQYNINFDRMTSRIYLRYSGNENSAGKIDVYVDDSTMSGTPVATINVSSTGSWSTYTDISGEVNISVGNHKIYLKFTTDTGKNHVCNLDYFQFEYKPENANIKHEAEKAHAYVRGTAGNKVSKESSDKYSNGAAIGKMNTYMEHDRSYLTTYVKAANAGYYNMTIKYSGNMTTSLQYRINNGSWNTCDITDVGSLWDEVKSVDVNAGLKQGINKIDISGAVWNWKKGTPTGRDDGKNVWDEWLNIDCFTLEYSEDVKLAFSGVLDTTLKGNKIQAEDFAKSSGDITVEGENDSYVDGKNLGGLGNGKWAEYNVFFDRKVSKIYLRNSVKNGDGGRVEIYVDDSTMSGTPVATVETKGTGPDWTNYVDTPENISIPSGNHEIYLKFVADGSKGACNLDYFQFEYEPETVSDSNDKHEAENAHAYIQGDADSEHNIQEDNAFSNGKAVGGMNAWPDNGRAYLTSYVDVKHAGKYKLNVAYASGSSKDTNIDCRINSTGNSSWTSISAPVTGGWTTVKTISTEVTLNKGVNVIDITGASNIPYSESNSWQQANVDYFKLERVTDKDNLAFGKPVDASGSQPNLDKKNAVDEDEDTRWGSGEIGDKGYFTIDLEKLYEIEKVSIMFEKAYPDDFQILVSRDNVNWTVARTVRGFKTTDTDKLKYESDGVCLGKARYVKVRCIKMAYHDKMSIRDIRVYGSAVKGELSDLSVGKDVKVSSSDNGATTSNPKNAVDGKDDTRWAAPKEDANPWYQIDLGKQCAIDSVDLKFERAYAKSFKIQISNDGKTWTDYRTVTDWTEPGDANEIQKDVYYANLELGNSIHMNNVKTRYVRLYTDEKVRGGSWGLSLYEFEVWGKETDKTDYWTNQSKKNYGIYPISALQDTEKAGMIDSSLVQDDVIGTGDTYDVVYEANKDLYFYVNPRELYYEASKHTIYWSSGNSGDELRGAESHDEGIVSYKGQQQATVKYMLPENLDFGDKDYVETQIGCQIFEKADSGKESLKFSLVYKVRVWKSAIIIEDKLSENGSLCVKNPESGCTYEWQKSSDGETWTDVAKKRYDLEILGNSKDGITNDIVHVAEDLGGGKYYRVRKSGTTQWSHSYKVQYYNNIQNGDFEYPAMFSTDEDGKIFPFNSNGDEQQYPNGYEGLMWKTTAPGWTNGPNSNRVGHDIEIVNGRKLKTSGENEQVSQFSVTQDEMYKNNAHGDQFAELNCENVGALYQDILTTPNSQCYWDLDYAGRWCQNSMYVVAMSAKDAKNYTTAEQIKALISRDDVKAIETNQEGTTGTTLTLSDGVTATMWKVTSKKNAGEWNDHNGIYNAPSGDKNYITRFFFVSAGGAKRNESDTANETVGSLLDNVTFEQRQSYTIEYYVDGQKQDKLTVNGTVNPYDRVAVPSPSEVSELTLYQAKISGENDADSKDFYVDENDRNMTVAYNHNVLKLYYKSGIVVATVKVEGLDTIPDGYTIVANLKDKSGTILQSKTINQSDFVKIENAQGGEASGYFKTVTFEGAKLTNQNQYTVEEEIVSNNYLPYYLEKVNKNGTEEEVGISHINGTNLAYTAEFTYSSAKGNSVEFINIYNPIRKVTIKKNVSGNMAEKDKNFNFAIAIEKDGKAIDAAKLPNTGLTETETGKYTFSLKHSEEIELYVYNNCKVTVTEDDYSKKDVDTNIYSDEYYKTSWVINQGDSTDGREVTVNKVTGDTVLSCTNTYNDLGDVEVQGFQMNGNKDKGGVSEYSPSFRVVCRVSKNTIKGKKVNKFGVIYAIKGEAVKQNREQLEKLMTIEGASGNSNVKVHEETPNGVYADWSTKEGSEFSTKYWSYYGLTFKCLSYMFDTLEEKVTVRAYAEMADGKIEYGNNIYTVDMYEIAKHLYSNQKMSTLKGHKFLYNNVLNLVDMQHNRAGIAKAMMKTLNVTSTSSKYYNLLNTVYRDMNDFIYCQNSYKGKYSQREEFYSENLKEEQNKELLDALNNARGTTYTDLNQWIYNEVEKIGNYKGYYRKVQYEWNGGIYIRK